MCVCVCKILLFYFWLCPVLLCCLGFSRAVASGGYSLAVVCRLLIAVACLVEHRLSDTLASAVAAPGLLSTGLIIAVHGLSCSKACGIFQDQGRNLCVSYTGRQILYP